MKMGKSPGGLRRWRKRGYYSEQKLVKKLKKLGFGAVRIPASNPSMNPLPDVIGTKDPHTYAFEVKNASYYAYFPKRQIVKLFRFLDELVTGPKEFKHAVLAAHLKKKWIFQEVSWSDYEQDKLPDRTSINRRQHGNWKPIGDKNIESRVG